MSNYSLTTATVTNIFAEVIQSFGGRVSDTFDDGRRLFARSLLPYVEEVRPKDRLQGGVAIKATERDICLYPYVFREVCSNGAIMAHALTAQHLVLSDDETPEETLWGLREAIGTCCQSEVFRSSIAEIRSSVDSEVDLALSFLPFLSRLSHSIATEVLAQILERFLGERGRSRYDLMNAVTSVARDTRDPDEKWQLEELGGGIGAGIRPKQPCKSPGVSVRDDEPVGVR